MPTNILNRADLFNSYWDANSKTKQEVLNWVGSQRVVTYVLCNSDVFTGHLRFIPNQLEAISAAMTQR